LDNPRPEKVAVVDEVRERLGAASAAILTEYRGLSVKDLSALRRTLTAAGGSYKIYKNTLVGFAARDLGLDDLQPLLTGPTAIAFVEGDAAEVAKALRDFSRTHPLLVVKGGLLGKSVLSPADTTALADLPSREVLLARVAGAFAAPMVQFAGLLQALPRNFAYGLKALLEKGGADGAPSAPAPDEAAAAPVEAVAETPAEPAAAESAPAADEAPATPPADEVPETPAAATDESPAPPVAAEETPATTEQPAEGAPEATPPGDGPAAPEPTPPSTDQPAEGAAEAAPTAETSTPTDPAQES
jgi:large subunit ribosomal protein L10